MKQSQALSTGALTKVPAITLGFWVIKILATTLGETGGDSVSMSFADMIGISHDAGYIIGTLLFLPLLLVLATFQIRARTFHPALYWATIIASTTAGTTMADYATRSLGIGYTGGSTVLLALVLGTLILWKYSIGKISSDDITDPKAEMFYWTTITFSQTLGTALGDWIADTSGFGYLGAAAFFAFLLAATTALYYSTSFSRVMLFWVAFILTRPLGATVGDFLDKPLNNGGLDLSRPLATLVLVIAMALLIWLLPQRAKSVSNPAIG